MAQKVYISDNLLKMRDHLKRNYEKFHQEKDGTDDAEISSDAENVPVDEPVKSPDVPEKKPAGEVSARLRYMPSIKKIGDGEFALTRERRELEGKVIRDLAAVESEMEILGKKLEEAEAYHSFLVKKHSELLDAAADGKDDSLPRMQAEYASASGRWEAYREKNPAASFVQPLNTNGYDRFGVSLIAGAIFAGCAIVSAVLIVIFT